MSLVGSLEDLGLGDILQIVSLARKSGRLLLRTDGESGRIVVWDGMVRGATIKGEVEDLRGLLVGEGQVSPESFESARELAGERGIGIDEAVVQTGSLPRERIDALRRQQVERAVMRMFGWRTGEFSFEVCDDPESESVDLLLSTGINTQYLAMEATRLRDEGSLLGDLHDDEDPLFSGEDPEPPAQTRPVAAAVDAMALASACGIASDDDGDDTLPGLRASVDVEAAADPEPEQVSVEIAPDDSDPVPDGAQPELPPLVAVDRNLTGLEWLKRCAAEALPRVHIFQHAEAGMDRIRYYLARGMAPLVALSPDLLGHASTGPDLLRRMRSLSSEMPVFALLAGDEAEAPDGFDGSLIRPIGLLPDPEQWETYEDLAHRLREDLRDAARRCRRQSPRPPAHSVLAGLRSISDRLRDPARGDDVLSLVLEFAARDLSRIAIFMLRDDVILGMAQRGMAKAGGPEDVALARIQLPRGELPPLFAQALEGRHGVRGRLSGRSSVRMVELLGGSEPREAYVAPIESGGCIAALLYADNLPLDAAIGDTTALEIVLHEAGLALDRALLERALANAQAGAQARPDP